MDIPRPDASGKKLRRRIVYSVSAILALAGITIVLSRLKPAVPTVDRSLVWVDTVKQGQMLRQVRGLGTLVPEEIRWIASRTSGRVNKVLLRPGDSVEPNSEILELDNPEVEQGAVAADSQLTAAEAEFVNLKTRLESDLLAAESMAAAAKAEFEQSSLRAEVSEELFKDGLVSSLDRRLSKVTAEQAATRNAIEQKRYVFSRDSIAPQLSVKQAEVDRLRAQARLRRDELDALHVRAGMRGVLQILPVEIGSQIGPGTNLARVANPTKLKAEIRVAETQARDVQIGQDAQIDTRNGVVAGKVARIDPSVQNGTVTVDVVMVGELPRGARPDLSVDGTIELERLDNVVFVARPAFGQERSPVRIYKLDADGIYADHTQVQLGRSSVNTIEILSGLVPGDRVILSDMSQWESNDRIKLN